MLFFRSEDHIDRWCRQWSQPRGAVLPMRTGWALARRWYTMPRNLPEWRRFTVPEIESVLASLGLSGPFWSLNP